MGDFRDGFANDILGVVTELAKESRRCVLKDTLDREYVNKVIAVFDQHIVELGEVLVFFFGNTGSWVFGSHAGEQIPLLG